MALSANTTVASTMGNYFTDNYQALLQAGAGIPATAYTAPATKAFEDWKVANNDKKFYLEKSGDTYKLGSVSGKTSVPEGAEAVDLNVAYGIESKEMSLVDWMMSRIGDEIRQANALQASGSLLSITPEADLGIDASSMSQSDLALLLKRLGRATSELRTASALGNLADRATASAALGLTSSLLGAALEQQRLFGEEAATLSEAQAVDIAQYGGGDGLNGLNGGLEGALGNLYRNIDFRDGAYAALAAAKAPGSKATEQQIKDLQAAYNTSVTDVTTAEKAVAQAETDLKQAEIKLEAADNFNEVMSAALAKLVAQFTEDVAAAQLAFNETAASTVSSSTLSGLTSASGSALNSRLKSAADLALLTNPNVSLFSALDVQETDDGYVVNTSAMNSREAQKAAVRATLEEALSDPALQTALADAMAANADSLGTADMALPDQTKLYNEVASAVISAMRSNDGYLDDVASNAVDFGNQLSRMLGNELVSASRRDNVQLSGMN